MTAAVPPAISEFRPETLAAIGAVKHALQLAEPGSGAGKITSKGGRDLVTAVDLAVEDVVRKLLTDALGLTVVGKERGGEAPIDASAYWLIDPICGTRNFASGIPLYCINLALVEGEEVTAAIVANHSTGEIDLAERGQGAWALKDGGLRRLTTSSKSQTIVIEDGKAKGVRREHAAKFIAGAIRADRWDFRSLGTTLALPYLAAGRVSAYVVFWVSAIHAAAGSLPATEAGAIVTDIYGLPWTIHSDALLASADEGLHAALLALARAAAPQPE